MTLTAKESTSIRTEFMAITFGEAFTAAEATFGISTSLENFPYLFQERAFSVAQIKRMPLEKITADIDCSACVRESST